MTEQAWGLIALCGGMLLVLIIASIFTQRYSLNRIKSKTVGDGQHGTARWATPKEIRKTYVLVPFQVEKWRQGENRPEAQGIVLGCIGRASVKAKKHSKHGGLKALVDCDDVHFLMIGASGVGKTAFFLYPNLEYDSTIYPPLEAVPRRFAITHRNRWMVDVADVVVAYVLHDWGGAATTLRYANQKAKQSIRYPD